ncbi:MAG: hypothetical protein QOE35_1396 [Actinomycetota bacterium]|jgi:hypothetical protein
MKRSSVLLAATIGFGLLYLAAGAALGTPPGVDDDARTVAAWFAAHGSNVRWWLWLLTLTGPVFAVFAALVRERLPRPHRDVFLFGAIAFGAETAVYGWFWGGLALHGATLEPSTAHTLFAVANFWGPVLTSSTVAMLAPIAVAAFQRPTDLPRWVGVVVTVAVAEQLAETVTIFGHSGFIAPGGAMNNYLGAGLTGLALVVTGVVLARHSENVVDVRP